MKVFYENDAPRDLQGKKVPSSAYGSQGHAHALNLRESGVKDLVVGLQDNSGSKPKPRRRASRRDADGGRQNGLTDDDPRPRPRRRPCSIPTRSTIS